MRNDRGADKCGSVSKQVSFTSLLWNDDRSGGNVMTMTDDEWYATAQGKTADNFVETTIALSIVLASVEIGALLTDKLGQLVEWLMTNGERLGAPAQAVEDLKASQRYLDMLKPDLAAAVRYSLIVIGACSAIEGFLEQYIKNRIRDEPSQLDGTEFDAAVAAQRRSVTDPNDPDQVLDAQYRAIKGSTTKGLSRNDPKPLPHNGFEKMLSAVGRDGLTPPMVTRDVNNAYVLRNVWAHNAGYADHNFILNAPEGISVPIGELVTLSRQDAQRYLSVIMTYGMIVANRERAVHNLGPIPMTGKPGDTEWGQAYRSLYI